MLLGRCFCVDYNVGNFECYNTVVALGILYCMTAVPWS